VSASGEPGAGDDELRRLVHDLRTPLTIVQGFSDLLVRRGAELEPEQRAEYAQRIADAARELRDLVDRAAERA
jgi:K+-sensing histidine kinase KdpD